MHLARPYAGRHLLSRVLKGPSFFFLAWRGAPCSRGETGGGRGEGRGVSD
jgi:hypothetical protein